MDPVEPSRTLQIGSPLRDTVLQVHFQSQQAAQLRAQLAEMPRPTVTLTVSPDASVLTVTPQAAKAIPPVHINLPALPAPASVAITETWPVRVEQIAGQWVFRAAAPDGRAVVLHWPDHSAVSAVSERARPSTELVLPERLQALLGVSAETVTRLLQGRPVTSEVLRVAPEPLTALHVNHNRAMIAADAIREVSRPAMLIPDISPAIPRPVAPDALPASVPVRLPVAEELGLRPGQVVQALIASSGEKMALTLNQQSIPLPPGRWTEGPVQARVLATAQGIQLQLIPEGARQTAVSASGTLTPALAQTLGRVAVGSRPALASVFSPGGALTALVAEFPQLARQLSQFQGRSDQLSAAVIAGQLQRNGLMLEHQLAQGIRFNQEQLKPWLRQLLQLLPAQHRLRAVVDSAVTDLESLQLEAVVQPGARDGQFAAILVWADQPPVEVTITHREEAEHERVRRVWTVDLHTTVDALGRLWLSSRYDGRRLDLTVWAERTDTVALARENLGDLRAELQSQGLHVGDMVVLAGPRPIRPALRHATDQHLQVQA
ncbi:MAG: flagellar hook-length control protein FliK [Litorivicinaceae bacterium]